MRRLPFSAVIAIDGLSMRTGQLAEYFQAFYPSRDSFLGRLFFRHGERKRIKLIRSWLPSVRGLSVLDVGCGDGKLLSELMIDRARSICLEDISLSALCDAKKRLSGFSDQLSTSVVDSFDVSSSGFDVVLAIGVVDYRSDLSAALRKLVSRTNGILIVDVPRSSHPRNWLRYLWFKLRGLDLLLVTSGRLRRALVDGGFSFDVEKGPFEWFIRIRVYRT